MNDPTEQKAALAAAKTPADKTIITFGGVRATARVAGRNPSSVSRWRKPAEQGGLGGRVPGAVQQVLLTTARAMGLALTAEDLIFGGASK